MDLDEATAVLARTPRVLDALLAGVSPAWAHRTDGPGTWSAYDIVGHLADGDATNWLPRTRMILRHGVSRPFEPFDRESMLAREPEPLADLLGRFQAARLFGLTELSSLDLNAGDMERRGLHPDLGEVTLGQLLSTWIAHDLTHVAQVSEVLARRYRDDVGPWRAYMPALARVAEAE